MRQYRKAAVPLLVLILLFLAGSVWAAPSEPYRTKLPNGMTVIIEEEHSAPVVSVQMWVKVGSADEEEKYAGVSHVFEHMLFKGTETKKVGEIAKAIESVGGDVNAYTSFDNTVYHLTVPSRYFGTGLDAIADAIQHSSFDKGELSKELEVVLEEIRMNEDNPSRNLYKTLLGTAYATHPYKRPVIGYTETVSKFSREDLLKVFRKWYVPNNMILVIVGDVKKDAALEAVQKQFSNFKKSPVPARKRPEEPAQNGIKTAILTKQVAEAQLGMAFHIPDLKSDDVYAIEVLQIVLSGGENSRLYKKLKLEDQLVHSIAAYPMSLRDPGLFFVTAVLDPKNTQKTISGTIREIERLKSEGPNAEEIQKAKFNTESSFIFSRETMDGLASKLGYYETNLGDMNYEKKFLEGIRKVTPEDVKKVAEKYLTPANMTIVALLPKDAKDAITRESLASTVNEAAVSGKAEFAKAKKEEDKVTKVRLENGMTLIIKEVHANPTVAFYGTFPGGLRYEPASKNGVGNFTAAMLTRGTAKRTREELAREIEDMSGDIGGFSGWNSTGVSAKFLSQFFEKGLSIYADVLMNPVFPEDEIEKLRKDTLAAIKRQEDNLPSYTFKLLYKDLYRAHPYGMPVNGTKESITALKKEDLVNHYNSFFVPERMVLTIVGDIDKDYAIERVKAALGNFKREARALTPPPMETRQTELRKTGDIKEREQVNIGIGFLGTTIGHEDSYPLKVMIEILSGQGGRLFLELRDRQSLAYSVSAFSKEGVDPGMIGAYIASAPGKKKEAIEGILGQLREITTKKVSEDDLKRAKMSIIGSYEIGLQEVSSQSADMANNELYGLGYGFYKEFPRRIEAVTADDVLRVAKKYLTLDAYTISIVGPDGDKKPEGK